MRRITLLVPVALAVAIGGCNGGAGGLFDPFNSNDGRITTNNLKQIGLALHNFHDNYGYLPIHGTRSPAEPTKSLLSWRVAILPYLEQAALYQQFNHNEPWDSEHNKKLIPLMPPIYASPAKAAPAGHTYWQQLVGPGGMSTGQWKHSLVAVTDGTSNTAAVVEAAEAVIWTKPADVDVPKEFAPGALKAKFAGQFQGGFYVLMWDGFVLVARDDADETALKFLFNPQDGQINNIELWQRYINGKRQR
jgi:hypothetical protein